MWGWTHEKCVRSVVSWFRSGPSVRPRPARQAVPRCRQCRRQAGRLSRPLLVWRTLHAQPCTLNPVQEPDPDGRNDGEEVKCVVLTESSEVPTPPTNPNANPNPSPQGL